MLDRGLSCRKIASELDRAPSTVASEVERHRFVTSPKAHRGESAPTEGLALVCERLGAWPRCCNGCKRKRGYGCSRRPKIYYNARLAQKTADAEASESRRGIDETKESVAIKIALIHTCLARGLSPEQIVNLKADELNISRSTLYRWIDAGFGELTNMELRKKVRYKPRARKVPRRQTRHSQTRSYKAFLELGEDMCAAAWEMDTVVGTKYDSACLLTLLHRPSRFQLALPLTECTSGEVVRAIGLIEEAVGSAGMLSLFRAVLTDNGCEFADELSIARAFGELQGQTTLYYCDPRQSQQKGACEKNHVEIRKLLPKGKGIRFDRLQTADCATLMSHVNSSPRGCLAWMNPTQAFLAAFGEVAQQLIDAFGIEVLEVDELNLTPECLELARKRRGEAPLA